MKNRIAIGEYKCEDGIIITRPKYRTYQVLCGGNVVKLSGQSLDEAQKEMVGYVAGLSLPPTPP